MQQVDRKRGVPDNATARKASSKPGQGKAGQGKAVAPSLPPKASAAPVGVTAPAPNAAPAAKRRRKTAERVHLTFDS